MTPLELFNEMLPYAHEYTDMLMGVGGHHYTYLPKHEDTKLAFVWLHRRSEIKRRPKRNGLPHALREIQNREKRVAKKSFLKIVELLRETSSYREVRNYCYEAAWYATKELDEKSPARIRYFTTRFRWRISYLLGKHKHNHRYFPNQYIAYNLTPPDYDSIIDYKNLDNWQHYLVWLSVGNDFGVRPIEKMTGFSKSLIALEVQHICLDEIIN